MTRRPVHELWLTFKRDAIPRTASPNQVSVMRDSFYAGALSLFQALNDNVSDGDEPNESDMEMMAAIDADLTGYPDRRMEEPA